LGGRTDVVWNFFRLVTDLLVRVAMNDFSKKKKKNDEKKAWKKGERQYDRKKALISDYSTKKKTAMDQQGLGGGERKSIREKKKAKKKRSPYLHGRTHSTRTGKSKSLGIKKLLGKPVGDRMYRQKKRKKGDTAARSESVGTKK